MKRIEALDPGGSTGWARWQDQPMPYDPPWDHFTCGQIGPHQHHEELYDHLCSEQTDDFTVVSESFEFRQGQQKPNIVLVSREYIGVAKLFCAQRNVRPVVLQTAGLAKGFIPDKPEGGLPANAKLKVMGLYVPGKPHANDAMRHLIYYMVNTLGHRHLIKSWKDLT
jgi:hypothetical protein